MSDPIFSREQAFQLLAILGEPSKVAHAMGIREVDLLKVIEEEGWNNKLKPILELRKSSAPGDVDRSLNRAVNFCQAHRLRCLLERTLDKICGMTPEQLSEYLLTEKHDKNGIALTKSLSTRALTDLAAAVEKCQSMTYLALSDTAQDRGRRQESLEQVDGGALHVAIAKAMSQVSQSGSPRALLFDAQLRQAERIAGEAKRPENPHDNDDH